MRLWGEGEDETVHLPFYLKDAYKLAEEFCRLLGRRMEGAGFLKTLLLRRVGSGMAAGKLTAEKLLHEWKDPTPQDDEDENEGDEESRAVARTLTEEERGLLTSFVDVLEPNQETDPKYAVVYKCFRLGLPYINRVIIPQSGIRIEDYFTVYPQLPKAVGDVHGRFMIRVEIPARKAGHGVLVTFGSAPPPDQPGERAYVLDIYDMFKPIEPLAFERLREGIEIAHGNVETAFEGSITEKLRSLFQPEAS